VNAAGPGLPPLVADRKTRRTGWIVGACVALVIGIAFARAYHPFPSDEERKYFGWWYGWEKLDDDNARAWVAEFRDDGELHIKFGQYHRVNADKDWQFTTGEEEGTWRVRDGIQRLVSDDPRRPVSWIERIQRWQESGDFHRRHSYRTTLINERELHYTSLSEGTDYQSLHSSVAIDLPPEPLPPEKWPTAKSPAKH
jgi:hypothetical protein